MTTLDQKIRRFSVAGLFVPVVSVLLCISYAYRAKLELGQWATYDNPDPKQLGWPIHHVLIFLSFVSICPALILSALGSFWLLHRRMIRSGVAILLCALFLGLGMTWLGQTRIGDEFAAWYLD